jgi:polar amino acid transport system substrate-binding protein
MTTRTMRTLAGAAALALGLSLSACGGDDNGGGGGGGGGNGAASSDLELVTPGTLKVCSEIPYKPFEYEEDGEFTGFDIDLTREIATRLDLELEVLPSSFDGLESGAALNSQQCDLAASAMTITEERKANIDFSDGYYESEQSLLVPTGSDIASIEDLAGQSVGVQNNTTGEDYTRANAPEGTDITGFPGDSDMFNAIQAGQVDALLQDLPVNLTHTEDGQYEIVERYPTAEEYGFALEKGASANLLAAVNEQLQEMRDDGTYDELYAKYFSTD